MACKPGSVLAAAMDGHSSGMAVASHLKQPTRTCGRNRPVGSCPVTFLPGLAPGGVYPAIPVTRDAVRSYRTFSPLPCEHGGLFSVALSLRSPSPGVTRHRGSVEPGLSSEGANPPAAIQPSDHLLYPHDQGKCQGLQYVDVMKGRGCAVHGNVICCRFEVSPTLGLQRPGRTNNN